MKKTDLDALIADATPAKPFVETCTSELRWYMEEKINDPSYLSRIIISSSCRLQQKWLIQKGPRYYRAKDPDDPLDVPDGKWEIHPDAHGFPFLPMREEWRDVPTIKIYIP